MEKILHSVSSQSYNGMADPKGLLKSFQLQAILFGWDDAKQAAVIPFYLKGKAVKLKSGIKSL